jgi:hypothetical protein
MEFTTERGITIVTSMVYSSVEGPFRNCTMCGINEDKFLLPDGIPYNHHTQIGSELMCPSCNLFSSKGQSMQDVEKYFQNERPDSIFSDYKQKWIFYIEPLKINI